MTTQQILGGVAGAAAAIGAVCHASTFGGDPGEAVKYFGFFADVVAAGAGGFLTATSTPARMAVQLAAKYGLGGVMAMMQEPRK